MRLSKRLNVYSDNEYSHTQNTSMAGKLIRVQAEQIRETPAEYVARKFGIRGDVDGRLQHGRLPEIGSGSSGDGCHRLHKSVETATQESL